MAKVRVAVIGSVGKSILIDPDLSVRLAALETRVTALGTASAGRHSALSGLQVGDDHPQYTMWQAPEVIRALWNFQQEPNVESVPLTEFIQDVVGMELVEDTTSISWTYNDAAGELRAAVVPEFVEDTVGAMLIDTASIDLVYNDGTGQITANVLLSWAPVWTANHRWVDGAEVQFGTGGDMTISHDGTDARIDNATGDLDIASVGNVKVETDGTERLAINQDGVWLLASDPGNPDQVLTSNGSGAPPTWEDGGSGGGGGGGAIYVNTTQPSGNTVANSSAETAFASSKSITDTQFTVGTIIRLSMAGVYGTDVVPPTLRLRVKLDSTTIVDSGAVTMTGSVTALGWSANVLMVVQSIGASGDVEGQGVASFATALGAAVPIHLANAATVTVDTTAGALLTATAQWGTADADNTITCRQFLVERLEAAPPPDLITLRGAPSRLAITGPAVDVTLTTPTGVVADDLLLVYISRENNAVTGSWAAVTPPSGWTQLHDTDLGQYNQMLVFWKRAGGSEPSTYVFTWPSSPGLFSVGGDAGIVAYQGVNTTTAIPDSDIAENAASATTLDAPSVAADADGSKLVCFFMGGNGGSPTQSITEPASMTQLTKRSPGTYVTVTMADENVVTGATGPRAAIFDSAGSSPSQCVSVILKPA